MSDKKEKKPRLRFPEFNDEWEEKRLGDLVTIRNGESSNNLVSEKGTIPYFKVEQLNNSIKYQIETPYKILYNSKLIKTGSIIFPKRGAAILLNKIRILAQESFIDTNLMALTCNSDIYNEFLYYVILKEDLSKIADTTSIPQINNKHIEPFIIKIPILEEQQKIANFLSCIDKLISNHQSRLNIVKNLKKAFLQRLFPKKGETKPEIRFSDFTDEWKKCKLGEKVIYKNGKGYEEIQSDKGKYELINLNSISIDGGLKPSGRFIAEEVETLKKNDLVMVLSDIGHGDLLGRVAIIPENDKFVLNQRVALLRVNDNTNPQFLFSLINAKQDYFKKEGAGSSQLNLSKKSVEDFIVNYPSVDEQIKIGAFFSNFNVLIFNYQHKLEILQNIKKGLLQQMFV